MAEFGANHPCFCPEGGAGIVLGKLVSANMTVQLATGELYADDALAEEVSEFASAAIAMQTDDLTDDKNSTLYGCKFEGGVVTDNKGDSPPRGSLAYYKSLMRGGVKFYRGVYYPRVRAKIGNDNAQTKGSNITLAPVETSFAVMADDDGNWRERETFTTAAAAKAWVETKTGVTTWHKMDVAVQNAGAGEGVTPVGVSYVENAGTFTVTITGHAGVVSAYDNGTDVTATITGGDGTYVVNNVIADHSISIVF